MMNIGGLHGSVVELHVGGADRQELGQQGSSMELRQCNSR